MRLFLYNYAVDGNWEITRDRGIFGVCEDGTHIADKAMRNLKIGDVVVIRDSTFEWSDCRIFGSCRVTGEVVLQRRNKSLCEDLLWGDEKKNRDIIYPFRWSIDIKSAPAVGRSRFPWKDLDSVEAMDTDDEVLRGRPAWQMKFRGNMIDSPREVRELCRVFWMRYPAVTT